MADLWFRKVGAGIYPSDDESANFVQKLSQGRDVLCAVKVPRNAEFHRKTMSLLRMAYENLELPTAEYKGETVQVSFDQFRHNMVVWAGHGKPVCNIKGEVRIDAQSLSYGECSQELIERIYSDLLNLISKKFSQLADTPEKLDKLTAKWMGYV